VRTLTSETTYEQEKELAAQKYPEHEKLLKVQAKSQPIGEFLEWLRTEQGVKLCKWGKLHESQRYHGLRYGLTEAYYEIERTTEQWLAEYFGVDLAKIAEEKRAMLEEMRAANKR